MYHRQQTKADYLFLLSHGDEEFGDQIEYVPYKGSHINEFSKENLYIKNYCRAIFLQL